jgi:hypothetical protein
MEAFVVTLSISPVEVVAMEVIEIVVRIEALPTPRIAAMVAVARIIVMVHIAVKSARSMKPRSSAKEDAVCEPFRPVVAVRGTIVRGITIVAIRAHRGRTNIDSERNLGRRTCRSSTSQADSSGCGQNSISNRPELHTNTSLRKKPDSPRRLRPSLCTV